MQVPPVEPPGGSPDGGPTTVAGEVTESDTQRLKTQLVHVQNRLLHFEMS
jgi:hypothetical protein